MAKNNSRCGCNSCGGCNNCTSTSTGFSSRGCGALRYLGRSSCAGCGGCNNMNGWNNRSNGCSGRSYANTDWPCAATCAGDPLFYTGPCGYTGNCCNNCCNNCCGCNDCNHCDHCCHCCNNCNHCNNCNNCGNCCTECDPCDPCADCCDDCTGGSYGRAAEFTAVSPQCESSGGALNFRAGACGCDSFEVCHGGVRINRCGRYIAMYSFAAPAGSNAATTLCLSRNGREMDSSRAFVAPATTSHYRQAHGQAIFEADAGDVISLNTSSALNIPDCACNSTIASLILMEIDG